MELWCDYSQGAYYYSLNGNYLTPNSAPKQKWLFALNLESAFIHFKDQPKYPHSVLTIRQSNQVTKNSYEQQVKCIAEAQLNLNLTQ